MQTFIRDVLRVAVGSSQGCQIDQEFDDVEQFLIFDVRNDAVEFVESRNIPFQERIRNFLHDAGFDPALDAVSDCQVVMTRETEDETREMLLSMGIRPLEVACTLVAGLVKVRGLLVA